MKKFKNEKRRKKKNQQFVYFMKLEGLALK